jgi:hypothetical protein
LEGLSLLDAKLSQMFLNLLDLHLDQTFESGEILNREANKTRVVASHYVRNSNQRHRSETHANTIISDLERPDAPVSLRRRTSSVEDKKTTIFFSARLS